MTKKIMVNMGFITNSSSCVYSFPREVLNHPRVMKFMQAYGITEGHIGESLWHRSECSSLLLSEEDKARALAEFGQTVPSSFPGKDEIATIFGDEYSNVTTALSAVLEEASEDLGLSYRMSDYN